MLKNLFIAAVIAAAVLPAPMALAGRVPMPGEVTDIVSPFGRELYTVTFRGGERAVVTVRGDGDSDLDLYVYDENGNLIAGDSDYTDQCIVTFQPRWTGPFTIEVKNRGGVSNIFKLETN